MSNWLIIGLLVVICLTSFVILLKSIIDEKPAGKIRINTSDPLKDTYTLELDISFGELDKCKRVVFDIVKE